MMDMTELLGQDESLVRTKKQRRAYIESIDRQQGLFDNRSMLEDPYILDWIDRGASEPGLAHFEKPEFRL